MNKEQRASEVQANLAVMGWTRNAACKELEISRPAMEKLWNGCAVGLEIIERFARGTGQDVNTYRVYWGFDPVDTPGSLAPLQREVGGWGEGTFPDATPESICAHLKEEVGELLEAWRQRDAVLEEGCDFQFLAAQANAENETADVLLILLHAAHRMNIDLVKVARRKFEVCKRRTWRHDPEKGYVRHAETVHEVAE